MKNHHRLVMSILVCLLSVSTVWADVIHISKDGDWVAAINRLQPGDIGQLEPGRYTTGTEITPVSVKGTPEHPITIRGAGHRASVLSGEEETGKFGHALYLLGCADLIIENLNFTNPSPFGIDGREAYSFDAREKLRNGITLLNSVQITIRQCRFADIATRGIFVSEGSSATIQRNLFVRVGDDTASGDVTFSGNDIVLRENLLAGNVSGFVNGGATTGVLTLERNLSIYHKWEGGLGIKNHTDTPVVIHNNVIYCHLSEYSALSINLGTDHVRFYGNVVHGNAGARSGGGECITIRGRRNPTEDIEIVGNWFHNYSVEGNNRAIKVFANTSKEPSEVRGVWILHNIFDNLGLKFTHPDYVSDIHVSNNIFRSSYVMNETTDVKAASNLYEGMEPWRDDSTPIAGIPIYAEAPVGPLAVESPGRGQATVIPTRDFGTDIGIPQAFSGLAGLETSILNTLRVFFTEVEIQEAVEQGGLTYGAIHPDHPTAYWKFDEGTGSVAADASGNGNDGIVTGATWAAGKIGNALRFDGVDDKMAPSSKIVSGTKTISAWIKPEPNGIGAIVGSKLLQLHSNRKLRHYTGSTYVYSDQRVTYNQWNHVALVLNEMERKVYFYIDGEPSGSAQTGNFDPVVAPYNNIGVFKYSSFPFKGVIDDVRIYNRILNGKEIQSLASLSVSNPE